MSASTLHAAAAAECTTIGRLSDLLCDLPDPEAAISTRHRWYLPLRFVADLLLALSIFLVSLPFVAIAAVVVKLTSPGPMFYCQTRVGKNGRSFTLFKLRTMVHNAEALSGPVWADHDDPRVTPFGRFLRNTHLDEFPQLVNVLLGQMSLIGPRPERPEFVSKLEWELPHYRTRLKLRPGITGMTQLLLPPDSDVEGVRRKLVFDMYYVCSVNPWLDVRILGATARYLLRTLWYSAWKVFALPSPQAVEASLCSAIDGQSCGSGVDREVEPLSKLSK